MLRVLNVRKLFVDLHAVRDDSAEFQTVLDKMRATMAPYPDDKLKATFTHQRINIDGSALDALETGTQDKVILFLHGGAYVLKASKQHWELMVEIGQRSEYNIACFDYPIAPEHDCATAIGRTLKAYQQLLTRYDASKIVLMGDSAGAGLAAALSIKLKAEGIAQPSALILYYPWLDVSMSHPEARAIGPKDFVLTVDGLIDCGKKYAGDLSTQDPLVSPWFGNLEGLPPTHIFTGTHDVLHPEGRDFHHKLAAAGCETSLHTYRNVPHAWLFFPTPEKEQAVTTTVDLLRALN